MIKNIHAIITAITMLSITHMTHAILTPLEKKFTQEEIDDKKAFKCSKMLARNRVSLLSKAEKQAHRVCEKYLALWAQQYQLEKR